MDKTINPEQLHKAAEYGPSVFQVVRAYRIAALGDGLQLANLLCDYMTEAYRKGWEDREETYMEQGLASRRHQIRVPIQCECGNREEIDVTAPPCSAECGRRMLYLTSPTREELREALRRGMRIAGPLIQTFGGGDWMDAMAEDMERSLRRGGPTAGGGNPGGSHGQ